LTAQGRRRFDAGVKPHLCLALAAVFAAFPLIASAADPFDQSGVALEVDSPDPKLTKIVLLAGGPSSKPMAHEYFAGCALLMDWLKQQPGVWPVLARDWPKNEAVLKGTKCVVYFGDGGGKQPFISPERWAAFGKLMDAGAGLVLLHQAMDFPSGPDAEKIKGWLGGVFHADIGNRGHWDMDLKPAGKHPVLAGVGAFAAPADGWLFNLHFAPGATPLLVGAVPDKARTTADAKAHVGRDEVIAWAYQRPGRGRGFGFTGADLHKSWGYESQRRMVVNGILWAAGQEVPAGGAPTQFNEADLNRNLDRKETAAAKKTATTKSKAKAPARK
jgi:Trehalose utilisation